MKLFPFGGLTNGATTVIDCDYYNIVSFSIEMTAPVDVYIRVNNNLNIVYGIQNTAINRTHKRKHGRRVTHCTGGDGVALRTDKNATRGGQSWLPQRRRPGYRAWRGTRWKNLRNARSEDDVKISLQSATGLL